MNQPPPLPPPYPRPLPYQAPGCPNCRCPHATKVGFTWWGGVLGPKILNHVRCSHCGTCYNGKTGQSNTTGIIIYSVVGAVLGLVLLAVFFYVVGSIR